MPNALKNLCKSSLSWLLLPGQPKVCNLDGTILVNQKVLRLKVPARTRYLQYAMKDSRNVALNIPVKDSTLVAEKESLQQLVCVRFHKHCVHLSILRGKLDQLSASGRSKPLAHLCPCTSWGPSWGTQRWGRAWPPAWAHPSRRQYSGAAALSTRRSRGLLLKAPGSDLN